MDALVVATRFPSFRRHLRAEVCEGRGAYLFSERGITALPGAEIASLAALLDGRQDLTSVVGARPGGMQAEQVTSLIGQLVDAGLVTLRPADEVVADERSLAYWDACGVDGDTLAADRTIRRVGITAAASVTDTAQVEQALQQASLDVVTGLDELGSTELTVVLCDDYLDPWLAEVDTAHRARGRPWLLAKPTGAQVWLGPVFQPGDSACWHCLANRLWGHRQAEASVQASLGRSGPAPRPVPSLPSLTSTGAHLIALEVTKWLAGHRHRGQRGVWTLDTLDLQGQLHELRAGPQCPECGDASLVHAAATRPVVLQPAPKALSGGGGHRTLTPSQVLERYRHLVSPITGIIKEIKPDPHAPSFVNSYRSGVNVGRGVRGMGALRANLRSENGGKGATPLDAEVGALCEAVERYSAGFHGDEHRVRGSLRSLGEQAISPNDCLLFDERQYTTRSAWNAAHSPFNHICAPVDEDVVTDWTPLWSLTEQRHRLLPTSMLYFGAPDDGWTCADSNGNAAGSSLEDAILQGILELVERDAVALWWYNRTSMPGVDLHAFADPWVDELEEHYARLGRDVWVLDVTSDLGVPVMTAISRWRGESGDDGAGERIMLGFGAHPDPRTALRRALSELNQLLPAVLASGPEPEDPDAAHWLRHASVENQRYLLPDPATPSRVSGDFPYVRRDDVRDDVETLVAALAAAGMETLVLDQTRPDVGLPVVKTVVPGMRPFWARFAPGRLFDVPVRLGRFARPTEYDELNPIPLFL